MEKENLLRAIARFIGTVIFLPLGYALLHKWIVYLLVTVVRLNPEGVDLIFIGLFMAIPLLPASFILAEKGFMTKFFSGEPLI